MARTRMPKPRPKTTKPAANAKASPASSKSASRAATTAKKTAATTSAHRDSTGAAPTTTAHTSAARVPAAPAAPPADVVVLGSHPCCYFAATLLSEIGVPIVHATLPGEVLPERLVLINPATFDLHASLKDLSKRLELAPIYGLLILGDDANTRSEHVGKSVLGYVARMSDFRDAIVADAKQANVPTFDARALEINRLDERGVELAIDGVSLRPKLLIVGGDLTPQQRKVLDIPQAWDREVPRRYTYMCLKGTDWVERQDKPTMAMSLDLKGTLQWAWLMAGTREVMAAVEEPADGAGGNGSNTMLRNWIDVLIRHHVLHTNGRAIDFSEANSVTLPLAGALAQEDVANRTLLIGPAGGFFTACAEDIYPNCWSALFAVDVVKRALKERHLQDALGAFRQRWGTTLGDYLRGPQQNLRFLLPLVYRNPVMTARMTEAILAGTSVVR